MHMRVKVGMLGWLINCTKSKITYIIGDIYFILKKCICNLKAREIKKCCYRYFILPKWRSIIITVLRQRSDLFLVLCFCSYIRGKTSGRRKGRRMFRPFVLVQYLVGVRPYNFHKFLITAHVIV
jgi:hypothetical protein